MKTIHIIKAAPILEVEPVESLTIVIDQEIGGPPSLPEWERLCNEQAQLFCDAILNVLPQGVTDRILAELTKRKASLYIRSQRYFERVLEEKEAQP